MQVAGVDEAEKLDALLMALDGDLVEGQAGQKGRDEHEPGGDDLRAARAHEAAEEAR